MDVAEAVRTAKRYVSELFAEEHVTNLGLEEVDYDDREAAWLVTLGFSRPWDAPVSLMNIMDPAAPRRSYKVVRIDEASGQPRSVSNRAMQ